MTVETILPELQKLGKITVEIDRIVVFTKQYGRIEVVTKDGQVKSWHHPAQYGLPEFSQTHSLNTFLETIMRLYKHTMSPLLWETFDRLYGLNRSCGFDRSVIHSEINA